MKRIILPRKYESLVRRARRQERFRSLYDFVDRNRDILAMTALILVLGFLAGTLDATSIKH